jgi:hypothetical protein
MDIGQMAKFDPDRNPEVEVSNRFRFAEKKQAEIGFADNEGSLWEIAHFPTLF